ncbi:hypothetical protein B0H12DRAFT_1234255 [Mycena haematopus]|nr:hypothetical protein B0H12DRAFT_1234255 [Mycena haematopus]
MPPVPELVPKICLIYPAWVPRRHTVQLLMRPGRETLGDGEIMSGYFSPSPTACSACNKPHMKHSSVTDGTFTVIFACQHADKSNPDFADSFYPNKSVHKLMGYQRTCFGHVIVVKHALPLDPEMAPSNDRLQVASMEESDYAASDAIVRECVMRELWKIPAPAAAA